MIYLSDKWNDNHYYGCINLNDVTKFYLNSSAVISPSPSRSKTLKAWAASSSALIPSKKILILNMWSWVLFTLLKHHFYEFIEVNCTICIFVYIPSKNKIVLTLKFDAFKRTACQAYHVTKLEEELYLEAVGHQFIKNRSYRIYL